MSNVFCFSDSIMLTLESNGGEGTGKPAGQGIEK